MIHVYPGMGATAEMYTKPWRRIADIQFHNWGQWNGEASISAVAQRVIKDHSIQKGDTVIGSSLGGIVACEIANTIEVEKLVLIGSATSPKEVNKLLKTFHPFIDITPVGLVQLSSGKIPLNISQMFSSSDADFIRHMCRAIFLWEGLHSDVSLLRVHGKRDHVIPSPSGVDHYIDGGHLIAMTHAESCVEIIKPYLGGII